MERGSIQIFVALKHIGNVTKKVKEYPLLLRKTPRTLRDLIEETVLATVAAYRERERGAKNPHPLTQEQIDGMGEIGKIAFGFHYNQNGIDERKAVKTAMDAVTDGYVRVFRGNGEMTDPDAEIEIAEGDVFTFVRLTMLSGRMW